MKKEDMRNDVLTIGGHAFTSRFILGSGKYDLNLIHAAVSDAGAQMITLALRRANSGGKENILDYIPKGDVYKRQSYIFGAAEISDLLTRQVSSSVRWQQSVEAMIADGVTHFVEIGPGRTLSSFVKKISGEAYVYNVEKWDQLDGLQEFLNKGE